jgi:HTH-type transcriptional regulator / antitoxin HigA
MQNTAKQIARKYNLTMTKIKNKLEFEAASSRIEELLKLVNNTTPAMDNYLIELDLLSNLVAEYEEVYYPLNTPSLPDIIRLRMYEMNLSQLKLSELIGVSPSRISEYLSGKAEPTLKAAREISRKLDIDANIILGV